MNSRRQFIITLVPAALALGAAPAVLAQTAKADENDPVAKSLGYKHDASKVEASYRDGMLRVRLGRLEASQPRRIEVT